MIPSVSLLMSMASVFLINPSAWEDATQYFHQHEVETCWLKHNMNKNEPVLAEKIKAACEATAAVKRSVQ